MRELYVAVPKRELPQHSWLLERINLYKRQYSFAFEAVHLEKSHIIYQRKKLPQNTLPLPSQPKATTKKK